MPYSNDPSESPLHLPEHSSALPATNGSFPPVPNPSAYGPALPTMPLPPALAAPPDMMSLLKCLQRHWLLATTLGLLAAAAASTAVWYFTPVKYVGEMVLRLNMTKVINSGFDSREGASPFSSQTLASLAKMRFVVRAALDKPGIAELPSVRQQLEPVEWLRSKIDVGFVNMSPELLQISIPGTNPAELKPLVDAVGQAYREQLGKAEGHVRQARAEKLDKIIDIVRKDVDSKKKYYEAEVKRLGAANAKERQYLADFHNALSKSLQAFRVGEQIHLEKLQVQLLQVQQANNKSGLIYVPEVDVLKKLKEDHSYQVALAEIERDEKRLAESEPYYASKEDRKLRDLREQIASEKKTLIALKRKLLPQIKKDLQEEMALAKKDSAESIKQEIELEKFLIDDMNNEMDNLEKEIKKQGPEGFHLDELIEAYKPEEDVLDSLRKTRALVGADLLESTSSVEVQDAATVHPEQNIKKLIMMAGGAGGAAMGLILLVIAYWEFRARRIKCVEDVVHGLGWRLVGQLPALPDQSRGLLRRPADPGYWQSIMTESVDATRTMILHAARVDGLRTVMVTSAVSGEGKTSLSCHLACSLARAGRKTLLLDCDLRNPAAHRLFELPGTPGLCEVLRGESQLADVIRATPARNLWLIPAGQFDEQALQMFTVSQDGFCPLLDRLKTQFDFIVIDSSPVLPVVDTLVIGQNVDVVVFSLLRDVSRVPNVYAAYQRLATLGIRILGAVVNGVEAGRYGYSSQYAKQTI